MKIPTTLKHKPVIVAENYDSIDGRGAYHSDAKGLSLGLAQWNDRGKVDIGQSLAAYRGEMVAPVGGAAHAPRSGPCHPAVPHQPVFSR